jgi:hypothetical protein
MLLRPEGSAWAAVAAAPDWTAVEARAATQAVVAEVAAAGPVAVPQLRQELAQEPEREPEPELELAHLQLLELARDRIQIA